MVLCPDSPSSLTLQTHDYKTNKTMKYIIPFFAGCLVFALLAGLLVGAVQFFAEIAIPSLADESGWRMLLTAAWVILTAIGGCISLGWKT